MEEKKIKREEITPGFVIGGAAFLYIVGSILTSLIAMIIGSYLKDGAGAESGPAIFSILSAVLISPPVYSLIKRGGLWKFRGFNGRTVAFFVVIALCLFHLYQTFIMQLMELFSLDVLQESVADYQALRRGGNIPMGIMGIAVAPAILEELLFRGAFYGALRVKKGVLFSACLSSLVFALLHGLGIYTLVVFLSGMILCAVYEATGTLFAPMLVHFGNNLLSIIEEAGGASQEAILSDSMPLNIVLVVVSGLCTASFCIFFVLKVFRALPKKDF